VRAAGGVGGNRHHRGAIEAIAITICGYVEPMTAAVEGDVQVAAVGADVNEIVLVVGGIGRIGRAKGLGGSVGAVQRGGVCDNPPSPPLVLGAKDAPRLGADDNLVAVNRI